MKKVISLVMVIALVAGCLTGCSNKKAFEQSEIIRVLEKHGFEKADSYSDMYSSNRGGLYYIAEDEDEAREFASFKYSMKSLLTSQIEEEFDDEYYRTSSISLYSFEESEDAEEVFDSAIKELARYYDVEFAEKDGYQYVCYTESGEPVCKEAIYLCDTNILYIRAYCPEDGKTGFGSYIFKELGLVEPKVKD